MEPVALVIPTLNEAAAIGAVIREIPHDYASDITVQAARAMPRILEVPLPYRRRTCGSSKVAGSLNGSLRAGTKIVTTFFRVAVTPAPRA